MIQTLVHNLICGVLRKYGQFIKGISDGVYNVNFWILSAHMQLSVGPGSNQYHPSSQL